MIYVKYLTIFLFIQKILASLNRSKGITVNETMKIIDYLDESPAHIHNWPFIVAIMLNDKYYCGGALISSECVLTSAHCVTDDVEENSWIVIDPYSLTLRLGTNKLSSEYVARDVQIIFVHPEFDIDQLQYDIAVLIMDKPIHLEGDFKAIGLQEITPNLKDLHNPCLTAGWSYETLENLGNYVEEISRSLYSNDLVEIKLPIISMERCRRLTKKPIEGLICSYSEDQEGPCLFNIGGPVICSSTHKPDVYKLTGLLTSWGFVCRQFNEPCLSTDVALYYDWITNISLSYSIDKSRVYETDLFETRDKNPWKRSNKLFEGYRSIDNGSSINISITLLYNSIILYFVYVNTKETNI